MSSYTPVSNTVYPIQLEPVGVDPALVRQSRQNWLIFAGAAFLVSVPVFVQAPLVRALPWLSLMLTLAWFGLSLKLRSHYKTRIWGDLLIGFSWTWLAGSIYWGWLRWEPMFHLPIEAIGLPFALICLFAGRCSVGTFFYLGSLVGTALTDFYFYLVDLIPFWRQLMVTDVESAPPIFADALRHMHTNWGVFCAINIVGILLILGSVPLQSKQLYWWAFGGAVLSTILVDGLFWLAASLA